MFAELPIVSEPPQGLIFMIFDGKTSFIFPYYVSSFLVRNEEFHDEEFLVRKSSEENEEFPGLKRAF